MMIWLRTWLSVAAHANEGVDFKIIVGVGAEAASEFSVV